MKRSLIATLVVALLCAAVLVVFFTASDYRVEEQGYLLSLSDFLFVVHSYNRQALGWRPAELTDRRYRRVMAHARRTAHEEVRERVAWSLAEWGEAAVPRLVAELESPRRPASAVAAAEALGLLRKGSASPAVANAIARTRENDRWLLIRLIDASAAMGPEMASPLVDLYRTYEGRDEPVPYNLLDAVGKSGGDAAVTFLLDELRRASTAERIRSLLWPLAFTSDERAARALLAQLHHPSIDVRRRARDATAQSMGAAAVEPAIDFVEAETDDFLRSWVLNRILARRVTAQSPRGVPFLASLVEDPIVGWQARYALAQTGSERGVAILLERADRYPPAWLLEHVDVLGARGLPLVEHCLEHEDVRVRRRAMIVLDELASAETIPLLKKAGKDEDAWIRSLAQERLDNADLYLLEDGFRRWLTERTGHALGRARPPDREGVRIALQALSFVHWVGLGLSVLVGLLLLAGWLRAFEPFKLALVLQFLLVEGIVGDFFFLHPATYPWATAGRMLLLLGLLFLRDDPLPGEARGRIERLAVRGLWIVLPILLLVGTPLFADSLRLALRDFAYMKWALLLTGTTTLLIIEQAFVPWDFLPRSGRLERALTLILSTSVLALFAVPLFRMTVGAGLEHRRALAGLLLMPFLVALAFHVRESRLFAGRRRKPRRRGSPPGRLRVVDNGDSLVIKLRRERRYPGIPIAIFGTSFLAGLWFLTSVLDAAEGGGPAMLLVMALALIGTALGALVSSGLATGLTMQVRDGALRWSRTFLGGAIRSSCWYRRVRLSALEGGLELTAHERRWIVGLLSAFFMLVVPSPGRAESKPAETAHPSDHVRTLESELPDRWAAAVEGLLGEDGELPIEAVASVVRRAPWVDARLRLRIAAALGKASGHPRALSQLDEWARIGEEPLRSEALAALLGHRGIGAVDAFGDLLDAGVPERLDVLRALVATLLYWEELRDDSYRDVLLDPVMESSPGSAAEVFDSRYRAKARALLDSDDAEERREARAIVQSLAGIRRARPEPAALPDPSDVPWALAAAAWLPGLAGVLLFVWGFNLAALAVRIRFRPVGKAKSLALGPVALEGVVEPREASLRHPVTGEPCVYYAGADREHPGLTFHLADETGRVIVQPHDAAILSDDGVLVAGERIHVVGHARRGGNGAIVVGGDDSPPPLYRRALHRVIELLFGFGRDSAVTRMLFSDPHRCFWIWDDLDERPLSRGGDVLWLAVGVSLAGAWIIVFALAAAGVIDAGFLSAV